MGELTLSPSAPSARNYTRLLRIFVGDLLVLLLKFLGLRIKDAGFMVYASEFTVQSRLVNPRSHTLHPLSYDLQPGTLEPRLHLEEVKHFSAIRYLHHQVQGSRHFKYLFSLEYRAYGLGMSVQDRECRVWTGAWVGMTFKSLMM